jgi:hypothetical protein
MQASYERPSLIPPGERPIMLDLGAELVNPVATPNLEIVRGRCQKTTVPAR